MANAAKGQVFGPGNLGLATPLTGGPDVFGIMERKQQRAAAEAAASKKAEMAELDKMMEYSPDEYWQYANEEIKADMESYSSDMAQLIKKGGLTQEDKAHAYQKQSEMNRKVNMTNAEKARFKEFHDSTKELEKQGFDRTTSILESQKAFKGKKIDDWEEVNYDNELDNPERWNTNLLMSTWSDNFSDQVTSALSKEGNMDVVTKNKFKSFVKTDEEGYIIPKPDGKPELEITPQLVNEAKTHRGVAAKMKSLMGENAGIQGYTEVDALEELLIPHASPEVTKQYKENKVRTHVSKTAFDNGQLDKSMEVLVKPWVALFQKQESAWRGPTVSYDMPDGTSMSFVSSTVPLATNVIAFDGVTNKKETIEKMLLAEDGNIYMTTSKSKKIPVLADFNDITKSLNNAKMSTGQREYATKYLAKRSDLQTGRLDQNKFEVDYGKAEGPAQDKARFDTRKELFMNKFEAKTPYETATEMVEDFNTWISDFPNATWKSEKGVEYKNIRLVEEDELTENEATLVGEDAQGNMVELVKDIDQENKKEINAAFRGLKFVEKPKDKLGAARSGGKGTAHGKKTIPNF